MATFDQRGQKVKKQTNIAGNAYNAGGDVTIHGGEGRFIKGDKVAGAAVQINSGDPIWSSNDLDVIVDTWQVLRKAVKALGEKQTVAATSCLDQAEKSLRQLLAAESSETMKPFDQTDQTVGVQVQVNIAHESDSPRSLQVQRIINKVVKAKAKIKEGDIAAAKKDAEEAAKIADKITD